MKKSELSIVIPVYNEEKAISAVINDIHNTLKNKIKYEIIVVNDGSTDKTAEVLKKIKKITIKNHPYNIGNGAAIKTGVRASKGKYIQLMDGDGQHKATDILKFYKYRNEYDMIVGQRDFSKFGKWHRNIANIIYNKLASYLTDFKVKDLTSGFRLIKRDIMLTFLYLLPNTFSYPSTITLSLIKSGYFIKYVPITVFSRTGLSKIKIIKDGTRFLIIILKIIMLFSPFKIFLPASVIAFIFGIIYFFFHNFSKLVIITIFVSILVFLLGLIAEQIAQLRYQKIDTPKKELS